MRTSNPAMKLWLADGSSPFSAPRPHSPFSPVHFFQHLVHLYVLSNFELYTRPTYHVLRGCIAFVVLQGFDSLWIPPVLLFEGFPTPRRTIEQPQQGTQKRTKNGSTFGDIVHVKSMLILGFRVNVDQESRLQTLRPTSRSPSSLLWGEGFPTKIDYRKKKRLPLF